MNKSWCEGHMDDDDDNVDDVDDDDDGALTGLIPTLPTDPPTDPNTQFSPRQRLWQVHLLVSRLGRSALQITHLMENYYPFQLLDECIVHCVFNFFQFPKF